MTKKDFITKRTEIISEMLDNPDEYGIYPTSKCFVKLDEVFDQAVQSFKEALVWCSGADDFQDNGKAREGWMKICVPLLTDKPS